MGLADEDHLTILQFGRFAFELCSHRLYWNDRLVAIQDQPARFLAILLESPGIVVSRDEIRKRLWPETEFLEFDAALNTTAKKLRQALKDDAGKPEFIKTVPRQGYIFISPVRRLRPAGPRVVSFPTQSVPEDPVTPQATPPPALPVGPETSSTGGRRAFFVRHYLATAIFCLASVLLLYVVVLAPTRRPERHIGKQIQLTTNSSEDSVVAAAISPDGQYLAYANSRHLIVQTVASNSPHILSRADGMRVIGLSWTNDSREILFSAIVPEKETPSLWTIPIVGDDPPRRTIDDAHYARISPNGKQLAVVSADRSRLMVMGANGGNGRTILSAKTIGAVAWSEDSGRIWVLDHFEDDWRLLRSVRLSDGQSGATYRLYWADGLDVLPGGLMVYLEGGDDGGIFEVSADPRTGRVDLSRPRKISPSDYRTMISVTRDGSKICFLRGTSESDVYVGDLKDGNRKLINARRLTLSDAADFPHAWMHDNKTILFESDRSGSWSLYAQPFDGLDAQLLVPGGDSSVFGATVPPDGLTMLYRSTPKVGQGEERNLTRVMRFRFSGGAASEVFTMRYAGAVHCPLLSGQCILSEQTGDRILFSYFDPLRGRQGEFRPAEALGAIHDWDVSPDGSTIAVLPKTGDSSHILLLEGRKGVQDLHVTGTTRLGSLNWWANGRGFFAAANGDAAILTSISISGEAEILTREIRNLPSWAIPSPDGKRLAYVGYPYNYQAWMLVGF